MITDAADQSELIKKKLQSIGSDRIIFAKTRGILHAMLQRAGISEHEATAELLNVDTLRYACKEERIGPSGQEARYQCYFIYSKSCGRCYVIKFNSQVKIITFWKIGRKTLNKYRRRFPLD